METNTIFNENCLDTMSRMPDNFIDLTVTSPPYDNLRDYTKECDWTFELFQSIAKEIFRVTKNGGVVVWIVGDATIKGSETGTSFKQALYFKDVCGFRLHDTMIYQKDANPFPETTRYYPRFEYMFILSKGKPKTFNAICDVKNKHGGKKIGSQRERQKDGTLKPSSFIKNEPGKKYKQYGMRGNVWMFSPGWMKSTADKEAYKIPAIFPEQLANDHIVSWSNEDDLVYDPFMGSGTTAKMAILNNRNFIGSEISSEYHTIALNRIANFSPNTATNNDEKEGNTQEVFCKQLRLF